MTSLKATLVHSALNAAKSLVSVASLSPTQRQAALTAEINEIIAKSGLSVAEQAELQQLADAIIPPVLTWVQAEVQTVEAKATSACSKFFFC